jgi:hypothetical protein
MNMMKDEKINMLTERINDLVQQVKLFSLSFNLFLAHLAKGKVSICHHLASVLKPSIHLATWFQRRRFFLEINQPKARIANGGHVC